MGRLCGGLLEHIKSLPGHVPEQIIALMLSGIWHSPEKLEAIEVKLTIITEKIDLMTGENRVIRQSPGQSYVTEPVRMGMGGGN